MINTQTENDPQFQEYLNGIAQNVEKYGNRAVDNLQYDGDNGYIVIKFKDDVRTTHVFKMNDECPLAEGAEGYIEKDLHKIHHELTEENEEEILTALVTGFFLNNTLVPFAELYDTEVDTSESVLPLLANPEP